jgi:hypothetical protein
MPSWWWLLSIASAPWSAASTSLGSPVRNRNSAPAATSLVDDGDPARLGWLQGDEAGHLVAVNSRWTGEAAFQKLGPIRRRCSRTSRTCALSEARLATTRWVPPSRVWPKTWVVAGETERHDVGTQPGDFRLPLGVGCVRRHRNHDERRERSVPKDRTAPSTRSLRRSRCSASRSASSPSSSPRD